ncbi:alanine racemase [Oricola thermophila]|uniref:Alanine racemase n=1 Tax=Oricola thermophila TaxID=2742145 RepID=A0A6N1VMH9_9HYPH|nr:alanine racemase [Oricola thermophila]QKV20197.1 alanine racemase [Oricola thermophila]
MSGGERDYFATLDAALKTAGIAQPVMVIDRDRLDANLDALAAVAPPDKALRIVAKSLPSPALLRHVTERLKTDRLMTFSVAMLKQLHGALPGMGHLLGKPVPVAAVAALMEGEPGLRKLATEVVWLVDTVGRIRQYDELARAQGVVLNVAAEIDVGLRRGGFDPQRNLAEGMAALAAADGLRFAGMMGYEPHLPALPSAFGIRARAERDFRSGYGRALEIARSVFGEETVAGAIRNSGGSKTVAARAGDDFINDLSVGSLLLKPLDFDRVERPAMRPAAFIATPVLKKGPFRIPGFGDTRFMQVLLEGGAREAVFIHGGHWLAKPVHPPGLGYSRLVGRSSNQEILVSRGPVAADIDDFVFMRPQQSEAVLLQFGPLAVFSGSEVVGTWETFPPTA